MLIIIGIVVVLIVYSVIMFNNLVANSNRVKNAWSQIEVQLKRRFDLIPNLIETVKGAAGHEKGTLEAVVKARSSYMSANTPEQMMNANKEMTSALGRLFAVAESYPDLKANSSFMNLQQELVHTEEKIGYARQFYNDTVMKYNNMVQMFPGNIFAGLYGYKERPFFETDESEKVTPQVKF